MLLQKKKHWALLRFTLFLDLSFVMCFFYYIENTLFLFRELLRKLKLKMKLRHARGQNQKVYQARMAIQKHRKNWSLIFQGNLKPLSIEETGTDQNCYKILQQIEHNQLEVLVSHLLDLLRLRLSSRVLRPRHWNLVHIMLHLVTC